MNLVSVRSFIDLLPYRIEQALAEKVLPSRFSRFLRAWRVRHRCNRSMPGIPYRGAGACGIGEEQRRRRLYIDLSVISRSDAGTGIQRVVRALALALREEAVGACPEGWDVRFVRAFRRSAYHVISWPAEAQGGDRMPFEPIEARPGDVFVGLDFSLDAVRRHRRQLARFRREGGALWFLVCDLLPAQRPEWFSPNNVIRYKAWLEVIAGISEGFLCISGQTETELRAILRDRFDLDQGFTTRVVPMGYDIMASLPEGAGSAQLAVTGPDRFDMTEPFTLMVGTLEPRKGHADILDAFDVMWQAGSEERLVLVGRMGWRVTGLRERITGHCVFGDRLLWFDDVNDAELERIYAACDGFIIASHAEGYGLPLIEALGHRKPVLARDLPIFRMHEDRGVRYFSASAGRQELAQRILAWIDDARVGHAAVSPPTGEWRESAKLILSTLGP